MASSPAEVAGRLATAEVEVVGRFASASNATLLTRLRLDDGSWPELPLDDEGDLLMGAVDPDGFAVYKPQQGEAPLWDFPDGTLYRREVAAYEVSRLLGWDLVPVTVVRDDAPFGPGSLQQFVPHDPARHYFWLLEEAADDVLDQLMRMVLFDVVVNNADRKAGHVLLAPDGRIRLVDHGVTFHMQPKLRTVAWDFATESVAPDNRADVAALAGRLEEGERGALGDLLLPAEIRALCERASVAAELKTYPPPEGPRPFPWPMV